MKYLWLIFLILAIALITGTIIYIKLTDPNAQHKEKSNSNNMKESTVKKKNNEKACDVKTLFEIKDIRNNQIYMKDGRRVMLISVSTPDYNLLTEDQQGSVISALLSFGLTINSRIQFFTTPTRIEVKKPIKCILETVNSDDEKVPEKLKSYSADLAESIKLIETKEGSYVRRSFCVIDCTLKEEERITNELNNKIETITGSLSRAGMKLEIVKTHEIIQLFTDILNKNEKILISDLENAGVTELLAEGVGRIVYNGE